MRLSKELLPQPDHDRERAPSGRRAAVVGGGIAGVAAAAVLAERGVDVVLVERESFLGGRAGAWTDELKDGQSFEMERGFHAFFRQYYNLRSLLRRVDPELSVLKQTDDYPILGPGGLEETFTDLPNRPPLNVIALTRRTPHLGWRDLMKVNAKAALAMLAFDPEHTYARFDDRSAKSYLDSLRFPPKARAMLFNVFAHSFFNPEDDYSAAELLMMFHFYFMGNPEGLIFDVANRPFSTAIWKPFEDYLRALGVEIRLGEAATSIRKNGSGWRLETSEVHHDVDDVVMALTVPALKSVVAASPELAADIQWRQRVDSLDLTNPFAVLRLWVDRPAIAGRSPFVGTTGVGILDNISIYELIEDESTAWSSATGGSVVELHAYAIDVDYVESDVRQELLDGFFQLYPEYRGAKILEERMLIRRDCPAFSPGSNALRPTVDTPHRGIKLAGDFIKLPMPSALMERATASGFLAANQLLGDLGVRPEPIETVPLRGILARPRLRRRA